jgi:myo-inositol-1(or 4)-monophosphatase
MEKYLTLAKEIADEATTIALKYFSFEIEGTWKADNTPLTEADTAINSLVIQKIKERYPDHDVQGEEESSEQSDARYVWVCDPIDGTMPYSLGLPMFTFSLALVDRTDGQPILGLVNDPVMKNMYWATKGSGAFRNGQKITVSTSESLKNTYLNLEGRGSGTISKENIIHAVRNEGGKTMVLLSFIYGGIQVANGKFSGAIFLNPPAHDVATLKIITEEAGGKATDIYGNERRYDEDGNGFVASNGILHQQILGCIRK